jgi:transposase
MKPMDPSGNVAEVLRLGLVEGVSVRTIARQLSMARKTVRKILGRHHAPAKPPAPRGTLLDPYDKAIHAILDDTPDMLAPAMLERLRPLGYTGGVTILRARLRSLRKHGRREAFLTLHFAPGAAVQIDWADFGFALPGVARRVSAFVAVLCHSRYLYIEFTLSQSMGSFLRCMDRCLHFFGGSTAADIFDNMKTVVLSHTAMATVFNPRFIDYSRARGGFAVLACNVRKGNEKGRVERPIGFVRSRFWPGRRFRDLLDLNAQASAWRDDFANGRVHEETGKVPSLVFLHEEKRVLKPLSDTPFNTDDIEGTGVTKMFRVPFDRNRYSVPWRLVSQSVVVRANDDTVGVFLGTKQVAIHPRCWGVGEDIEHPSHKQGLLEQKPRAAAGALPPALAALGETGRSYFKLLAAGGRSIHRETTRLVLLVELFGAAATEGAVAEVMQTGHVGAEYVEYVLRHKRGLTPQPPPLRLGNELDRICLPEPDLSVYDRLAPDAMTRDPGSSPLNDPTGESST